MHRTLLALLLAGFAAAPASAAGMSCADFAALDGGAQADMVAAMAPSGDGAGSMMMSGPGDDDAAGTAGGDASGSMMAGDDASGSMMAGDDAATMMAGEGADGETMAANVAALCAEHPEMSLDDAISGMAAPQ